MRAKKPDDVLQKLSKPLHYEFWMLGTAMNLLRHKRCKEDENVAIESFGIHARVLTDFLFKMVGSDTDVLAIDFLDDVESWKKYVSQHTEVYEYIQKRTGKEIAHLTTDRLNVTPDEKKWDCLKIYGQIKEVFVEFMSRVPNDKLEHKLFTPLI